jgi:hypothetical protein
VRTPAGPGTGDFERLVYRQRGVITTPQAERFLKPGIVRGHVRQGRWRRLCRGVLLTENGQLRREQQLWVAALVSGPEAHLAGWTAATEGGVKGLRAEPIAVIVPAERCRSVRLPRLPDDMPAVQIHRTTILPPSHRRSAGPPRTIVARAAVDGAGWAVHDDEARELIVRAWQQGRVTVRQLREVVRWFPALRRRRLVLQTIADIEGGATALSEIDFVRLCRRYRLPLPDLQRPRIDATGRKRFIDAHWASARLLVEVDGSHHRDETHWATDMLRQNRIWIAGDRILRFPAWLVRSDPAAVARQIREALIAAGHPALADRAVSRRPRQR